MGDIHSEDLNSIIRNISEVELSGTPGILSVFGNNAFAIITGDIQDVAHPIIAGARFGAGKITIYAHDGYLVPGPDKPYATQLLINNIRWASEGKAVKNVGVYAPYYYNNIAGVLRTNGLTPEPLNFTQLSDQNFLFNFNVILIQKVTDISTSDIQVLKAFVNLGGGLIVGGTGWAYGGGDLRKYPGNLLTGEAGLLWTGDSGARGTAPSGNFLVNRTRLMNANVSVAFNLMIDNLRISSPIPEDRINILTELLSKLRSVIALNDQVFLPNAISDIRMFMDQVQYFNSTSPLIDPTQKLILKLDCLLRTININCGKHRSSSEFPGSISAYTARLQDQQVEINAAARAWYSTGFYAPAGEIIRIEILPLANSASAKLSIRIGAHSDDPSAHPAWKRCPIITLRTVISKISPGGSTEIANSFGGQIYICSDQDLPIGVVYAKISGAVASPYFVLGRTTNFEWNNHMKNLDAPWSELECANVILTLPSQAVREVVDPESLMRIWNEIVRLEDDFCNYKRLRPDRMVADVDIGGEGYMHSGYPFMFHNDESVAAALSAAKLRSNNDKVWGFYHELGHNHQLSEWTFEGTTEVTNNVFVLYVMDILNGLDAAAARPENFAPAIVKRNIQDYYNKGAKFEDWKRDPFLALYSYYQLKINFGWDAYKRTFRAYQQLGDDKKPKNNQEKMDTWISMFSRNVGVNLAPLFSSWGYPVSDTVYITLQDLPRTYLSIHDMMN